MSQFKLSALCTALPALALLAVPPALAAETVAPAPAGEAAGADAMAISLVVMPKLYYFEYTDGPAESEDNNHYFQQYDPRKTLGGDTDSGFYPDVDLELVITDREHVFSAQREGFGPLNHRNSAHFDHRKIGTDLSYSSYTSGSNGADVLPGVFKQPSRIERNNLDASMTLKPDLLGDLFTATIAFNGYSRKGSQYETFVQGAHSSTSFNTTNLVIDENVGKFSFNLAASPWGGAFDIAYEAAIEKFNNHSGDDAASTAGSIVTNRSTQALFYLPDSTQFTQSLTASKRFGERYAVAAGASSAELEQDTFLATTQPADPGRVTTENAFVTLNAIAGDRLDLEGHARVSNRDNNSLYTGPSPNLVEKLYTLEYGLAANYRLDLWKSTLTIGLDHRDIDRDLPVSDGIFFRDETQSNILSAKLNARPVKGVTVKVAPSYTWSSKTSLATEPEQAFELKTLVSYAAPTGLLVSGFYNFKHQTNTDLSITETFQTNTDSVTQDIDDSYHTLGATLSFAPTENINASASIYLTQTDAETYYTSFARTGTDEINLVELFDRLNYKVKARGAVLNLDWQASDNLLLRASYNYTKSEGDTAEPTAPIASAVPAFIDNTIHAIAFGGEYKLNKTTSLQGFYQFEHYDDEANPTMEGGLHTFMLGLNLRY